jgi:hypothetical protein
MSIRTLHLNSIVLTLLTTLTGCTTISGDYNLPKTGKKLAIFFKTKEIK